MGKFSIANLKKTAYYLKRNGFRKTLGAVAERLGGDGQPDYEWIPVSSQVLEKQREEAAGFSGVKFSIVVPAYRTPERYLREMMESLIRQSFPCWELILADATEDDSVKSVAESYKDARIRYHRLPSNNGIAENTNAGIGLAEGDYIGLLDHDDVLTENALFEMAAAVRQAMEQGICLQLLYSDEDKCDGEMQTFYEPHFKENFNLDLLLSNNYICHFMVMKRELMQMLRLRGAYDGAQDFDLALRAVAVLSEKEEEIRHIPLVLYHWRCHARSTAENPRSKMYAYDAGRRAVEAFAGEQGWKVKVKDTEHLGFYRLEYQGNIFEMRSEVGALGGSLVSRGRIVGGRMGRDGRILDEGLPVSHSGYMHRAVLQQEAEALDLRNLELRKELWPLFQRVLGTDYRELPGTGIFDVSALPEGTDPVRAGVKLSDAIRREGYRLLYLPERVRKIPFAGRKRV